MTHCRRSLALVVIIVTFWSFGAGPLLADAWLDGKPAAIWSPSPGFYKDGNDWYAIIHAKPGTKRIRLVGDFTGWDQQPIQLTRTPDEKFWWFKGGDTKFSRPPHAGDRYKFIITDQGNSDLQVQDPAARRVENSSLTANSIVTENSTYSWHDSSWSRPGPEYYMIYQLHPLRFTARHAGMSPLRQVTEELNGNGTQDYINALHATAIQLLPVNEFPGDVSWGYNPSFFYAVESAYGTPDELKQLVDTAHQHGMAVVLDLVFNHGGSGDNILWQVAQTDISNGTYYDGDTVWGPKRYSTVI
jgi:1,4-alpha-glucan branching enzyme